MFSKWWTGKKPKIAVRVYMNYFDHINVISWSMDQFDCMPDYKRISPLGIPDNVPFVDYQTLVWIVDYYFDNKEDAMLFKLKWG